MGGSTRARRHTSESRTPNLPMHAPVRVPNPHGEEIDGSHLAVQEYYHSCKPKPFDDDVWKGEREGVMRKAAHVTRSRASAPLAAGCFLPV